MNERRCREILEVAESASMEEISHAYQRLKRIYGIEGDAFAALSMDEFSAQARKQVLLDVEAAYQELCRLHMEAQPEIHPERARTLNTEGPADGTTLRRAREAAGISLERLAAETHVRKDYLAALEEERFEELPSAAVYVRGYLTSYLSTIGIQSESVIADFMRRHQQWLGKRTK